MPGSPCGLSSWNYVCIPHLAYTCYMLCLSHSPWFGHLWYKLKCAYKLKSTSLRSFSQGSSAPCSETLSTYSLSLTSETRFNTHTGQQVNNSSVHFNLYVLHSRESRDSSVGIATGYGLDFHFSISSRPVLGSPPISYKMGTGGSFPVVKRQGREADHSPPTSAEVKKICIYTSTLLYVFMAWCLIS
jgi:hypothetical protein